jgi:hypothetical protein
MDVIISKNSLSVSASSSKKSSGTSSIGVFLFEPSPPPLEVVQNLTPLAFKERNGALENCLSAGALLETNFRNIPYLVVYHKESYNTFYDELR